MNEEMPPTLLLDTNIWIDYYLGDRPGSKAAAELISAADIRKITLAYPALSIKDLYYVLNQETKREFRKATGALTEPQALACREYAWACVDAMREIAVAAPIGEPQVWLACHYKEVHGDLEDDLVLASLETSKADFLVTNDEVLCRKAPKGALSATDMLAYLKAHEG